MPHAHRSTGWAHLLSLTAHPTCDVDEHFEEWDPRLGLQIIHLPDCGLQTAVRRGEGKGARVPVHVTKQHCKLRISDQGVKTAAMTCLQWKSGTEGG